MNDRAPFILVVEDQDDDLELTIRAIRKAVKDSTIVSAHDGLQAASYLGLDADDGVVRPLPDMAIIDIKMPLVNGLSLLRQMRNCGSTRGVPVMVFSSGEDDSEIEESKRLGAEYVRKPVEASEYCRVVGDYVLRHRSS